MLGADALIAEIAIDLVNAVQAADDQPLQVELRRNAQVEIHVHGVVVGHEGQRRRSTRDGLHHGCFHLQIAALIEEHAQRF